MNHPRPSPLGVTINPEIILEEQDLDTTVQRIDRTHHLGPIELSLLDRLERGLAEDYMQQNQLGIENDEERGIEESTEERKVTTFLENFRYSGDKEILHLEGWMNENGLYNRYLADYIVKIVVGLYGFFYLTRSSEKDKVTTAAKEGTDMKQTVYKRHFERWSGIPVILSFYCFLHIFKSLYFLLRKSKVYKSSRPRVQDESLELSEVSIETQEGLASTFDEFNADLSHRTYSEILREESVNEISKILKYEILFNLAYLCYLIPLILWFQTSGKLYETEHKEKSPKLIGGALALFLNLSPLPLLALGIHICKIDHKKYSYTVS